MYLLYQSYVQTQKAISVCAYTCSADPAQYVFHGMYCHGYSMYQYTPKP